MFRPLAFATLLCLPLPAAAQEKPLVDHIATVFLGLQIGYHVNMRDVLAPIKQSGPGVFEVAGGGRTVTTTITELEPCVFNYAAKINTREPDHVQFHMRSLVNLTYRQGRTDGNGMTIQFFDLEYDPGFLVREGEFMETKFFLNNLDTDIPIETLNASVAALKEACRY